jgi:hypothetical protein
MLPIFFLIKSYIQILEQNFICLDGVYWLYVCDLMWFRTDQKHGSDLVLISTFAYGFHLELELVSRG